MAKIRVKIEEHRHFYIHNDIANAAFHFKKMIVDKRAKNELGGIALDMIACLTMLAFEIEAKVNFLGFKLCKPWKESLPVKDKIKLVRDKLGVQDDWNKRPYKSFVELKNLRDMLAHGKPKEIRSEKEIITTHEELEKRSHLPAEWAAFLTEKFVLETYDD